ncbi:secretoglobin family 1D member 2 [Ursus arctos]|uniref:secretoglobin family 1D member 2 n=1 Tax=Ursus arctos TaxID=9644 RepID=UPI00201745F0|nr:secretoglobin family 1D member 2 [Ursus arctos]
MRLSLSVLLVTLALYCYEANAITCPAFVLELKSFLFLEPASYKTLIKTLCDPPQEVIQAKMEVKACTDQISSNKKLLIASTLLKTMENCI